MRATTAVVLLVVAGGFLGCGGEEPVYQEVERIRSPDGRWDAVVAFPAWEEYRGRTSLVVTRADSTTTGRYPQFVADCLRGFNVRWHSMQTVSIEVEKARIWKYDDETWFFDSYGSEMVMVWLEPQAEKLLGGCEE